MYMLFCYINGYGNGFWIIYYRGGLNGKDGGKSGLGTYLQ